VWVEGGDIHDELLDQLGGVLAPPGDLALTPTAAEFDALAAAVAARWPDGATAPSAEADFPSDGAVSPGASPAPLGSAIRPLRSSGRRQLRRIGSGAWRAGSVAAGIVLVSASAAAAANGGVPLPRPVRVVAYSVGLPVDSPALDDTNQHIKQLNAAVKAQNKPKAEASVRRLQTDLTKVPADEKREAVPRVEAAIAVAATSGLVPTPTPTTTTTAPPEPSDTATTAPAPSTTETTVEEKEKGKDKDKKPAGSTQTTEKTKTSEPEPTTTTTAPATTENPSGDPGTSAGDGGSIGTDPGPTTTTTAPPETTTTTGPPPEETTTTTTAPEPTTTTTASSPQPQLQAASVNGRGNPHSSPE
jgi:hypothetical protein